jgi:D-lactate dehydrogenase
MKVLVYSTKIFETPFIKKANRNQHQVTYTEDALNSASTIQAIGFKAIPIFSGDDASSIVLEKLWDFGVRFIAIRSSGYNNINIKTAKRFGFRVANAPDYSPYAIAEHAVALLLALNRKVILADKQVHSFNFLQDDLIGFDLHGKTVGIIGTGRIGSVLVKIMHGFGCKLLANDQKPNNDLIELCGVRYTTIEELCTKSDIISIHIPMTYENHQFINRKKLALMKRDVILINTARGAIVDTKELIKALENNTIGAYCTDVYEKEGGSFFRNNSKNGLKDEQLKKLLSFSNVLLTPHQAFITKEALTNIAEILFKTITNWANGVACENELGLQMLSSQ